MRWWRRCVTTTTVEAMVHLVFCFVEHVGDRRDEQLHIDGRAWQWRGGARDGGEQRAKRLELSHRVEQLVGNLLTRGCIAGVDETIENTRDARGAPRHLVRVWWHDAPKATDVHAMTTEHT